MFVAACTYQRRSSSAAMADLSRAARNSFGSSPLFLASRSSASNRSFSCRYALLARIAAIREIVVFNGSRVIGSPSRAGACAYCAGIRARPSNEPYAVSVARAGACAERSESWLALRPWGPTPVDTHPPPSSQHPPGGATILLMPCERQRCRSRGGNNA